LILLNTNKIRAAHKFTLDRPLASEATLREIDICARDIVSAGSAAQPAESSGSIRLSGDRNAIHFASADGRRR
jgi:hypothetical protein